MEFKSQHHQDEFIVNYFKEKREGVFVDIGAHDGESLSNTYVLEKELGWSGICIEPMPHEYEKLKKSRNCITYNCAIYDTNGTEKFTLVDSDGYPDMLSGITKDITIKHMGNLLSEGGRLGAPLKIIDVQTRILNEILDENKIFEIDVLSIDVEGAELKILKSIDYDRFHFKLIIYENGENTNQVRDFLKTNGFSFYKRLGIDDAFINNKK
jgi:FkbM family methyltransferase